MRGSVVLIVCCAGLAAPAAGFEFTLAEPIYSLDEGFDWSGFYAGMIGGYGGGVVRSVNDGSGLVSNIPIGGTLFGVTLGANMQHDRFVLGVEGDVSWSAASGSASCASIPGFSCNGKVDWLGSLRGRAGYTIDKTMVFGTAGLAAGGGKGTITPAFPGLTSSFSDTYLGWTVGGGLEVAVSEAVSIKAEYGYFNLGSRTAPTGTLATGQTVTVQPMVHVVKLGMNVHF